MIELLLSTVVLAEKIILFLLGELLNLDLLVFVLLVIFKVLDPQIVNLINDLVLVVIRLVTF